MNPLQHPLSRQMLISAGILAAFALSTALVLGMLELGTREVRADNARQAELAAVNAVLPGYQLSGAALSHPLTFDAPDLGGEVTVYQVNNNGDIVAVAMTLTAKDGYSGSINLLLGLKHTGEILGVRVVSHRETPGLGDKIETAKSDWIKSFDGLSLNKPTNSGWAVKKDGGQFDQFSGATITPRAIVRVVYSALQEAKTRHPHLFSYRKASKDKVAP